MAEDGAEGGGRLVVCPTPIGNLEDVTLRVLAALRSADVVACEDTRRTRVLLDRYGVKAKLVSYHEHNEQARSSELVKRMRGLLEGKLQGKAVEVTWYDGTVETVDDLQAENRGPLRKGPAFIEVR